MEFRDETEQKVWSLHSQGLAPSEIDAKMKLDAGTAHDIVVALWARQKATVAERTKFGTW